MTDLNPAYFALSEYSGWCDVESFRRNHYEVFQPCVFRQVQAHIHIPNNILQASSVVELLQRHGASKRIDISCAEEGEEFKGYASLRERVDMKLVDFLAGFQALQRGQHHWIEDVGLSLYLSQCCVYASESQAVQVPLPELAENVNLPLLIKQLFAYDSKSCSEELDMINIWMNVGAAKSSLHYDANSNLLHVLQGAKQLILISPSLTELLHPTDSFAETPNHSQLSFCEVQALVQSYPLTNASEKGSIYNVALQEGDVIFIPEGWWHAVTSNPFTLAVNYWFYSPLHRLMQSQPYMIPYILRSASHALVDQRIMSLMQDRGHKVKKVKSLETPECIVDYSTMTQERFQELVKQIVYDQEMPLSFIKCSILDMEKFWLPSAAKVCFFLKQIVLIKIHPMHV